MSIDQISEAIGHQKAQIAGLKDTMVVNHSTMDKKIDKVLDRLEKLNGSVADAHCRLNAVEPAVKDYRETKKKVVSGLIRLSIFTILAGAGFLTTAHASTIAQIFKIVTGG